MRQAISPDTQYCETYLSTVFDQARKAHRLVKQQAADIGTQAHTWIEAHFRGIEQEEPSDPEVQNCISAAQDWLRSHSVQVLHAERRVFSRRHCYAGTLDVLANVDGRLALLDWKSSKGIYYEYFLQTAAYLAAYEEETGERVVERWIIKLGKTDGTFVPYRLEGRASYRRDLKAFLGALALYKGVKENEGI